MAFDVNGLSFSHRRNRLGPPWGGTGDRSWYIWDYVTTDSLSDVMQSGYWSEAEFAERVRDGDMVRVEASDGKRLFQFIIQDMDNPSVGFDVLVTDVDAF